jgi:hypothetical protein
VVWNTPSLTLTLKESKDILLTHWSLHVTDDCSGSVIHELNADLSNTTTRTSSPKDLLDALEKHSLTSQTFSTLMTFASLTGAAFES